ncbi:hypothetical protein C1H76_8900 [Elsinoe australis]|uniref:Phosphatidic acid phosphatase type 2/haloperoxidase domain-containing protein n=1 Tax=Elsinoe australis TaxID=40998 RepID=A0A4U7AR09_9PEZI|nr:hypothetical protein C1H76_8900 [Elsinoe australis]
MARITFSTKGFKQTIHDELAFQRQRRKSPPSPEARPTFLEWLRISWPDILTMIVIGAMSLGFDKMWPPYHRLFPYLDTDGTIISPELAYPKRPPTLSAALSGILSIGIPILVFLLSQFIVPSFWVLNNSLFGILYANLLGTCLQIMIKTLIGGFRPHFLSVCQPDLSRPGASQGLNGVYHDWSICTGEAKNVKNALISFPSGHTEAAFASGVFFSLWLNAQLKVWSAYQPRFWKVVVTFVPLLGAVLMAGDLQMTGNHHWYDVLMGAVIGTMVAFAGYRAMFESVWDARTNDVVVLRRSQMVVAGERTKNRGRSTDSADLV